MRTHAIAFVVAPFAAMLIGCQTNPLPATASHAAPAEGSPAEVQASAAPQGPVPVFGPLSR